MRKIRKTEIIAYLEDKSYHYRYDYWPISWNIKIKEAWPENGRVDKDNKLLDLSTAIGRDGKQVSYFNDPQFDELWKLYVENNHDLFWNICGDWLGFVGNDAWWDLLDERDDPAIQAANDAGILFGTAGRSNGHLVLDGFNGDRLCFSFTGDGYNWGKLWDYDDLWALYKVCHIVDKIVDNRHESLAYLYADFRHQKEVEWAIIHRLPVREACNKPVNYDLVEHLHIEDHFCQCNKPAIPRANHFYCSTEDCTGQAINIISLERGHRKYMCKKCSALALEVNRWGPIKKIIPMET